MSFMQKTLTFWLGYLDRPVPLILLWRPITSAIMTFRSFIHLFAMIYYVIELAVLSFKGQQFFLKVLETLMLISTCLILLRTMIGDAKDSQVILFIDSCLFGLTAGWLCFASSSVEGDTCLAIFFSLNGIFAILLTCVNVRLQQRYKTHDAMCGDTVNEYPVNGDIKNIGKAPSEETCSTHNARYDNSVPSKSAKNTNNRSIEGAFETEQEKCWWLFCFAFGICFKVYWTGYHSSTSRSRSNFKFSDRSNWLY